MSILPWKLLTVGNCETSHLLHHPPPLSNREGRRTLTCDKLSCPRKLDVHNKCSRVYMKFEHQISEGSYHA